MRQRHTYGDGSKWMGRERQHAYDCVCVFECLGTSNDALYVINQTKQEQKYNNNNNDEENDRA